MLKLFRGGDGSSGLLAVEERFVTMLHDARHVFDLAIGARLGGTDPAMVDEDLRRTEERTDEAERDIRRRVLVHASVHGRAADLPSCLRYMGVAKDAERIGDLSLQLFSIAGSVGAVAPGPVREDLAEITRALSPLIAEVAEAFRADDVDRAHAVLAEAQELKERCRVRIDALLREEEDVPSPAATVLTYRQVSRVAANVINIASAVVMPLDETSYPVGE